jgi:hypothetical protein
MAAELRKIKSSRLSFTLYQIAFRIDVKKHIRTFQERYFPRNYCNGKMLFRSSSESCIHAFRIG